jgi:hypothetical protein
MFLIEWARINFVPTKAGRTSSSDATHLEAICQCQVLLKKSSKTLQPGNVYWVSLSCAGDFEIFPCQPRAHKSLFWAEARSTFAKSKTKVRAVDKNRWTIADFIPVEDFQVQVWSKFRKRSIPFPLRLSSYGPGMPPRLYSALYESILADDFLFVRSLLHFSVVPVRNAQPLVEAFLNIFAHAQKVNALIIVLCGLAFEEREIGPTDMLRGDSHLTNLLKVFIARYASDYISRFIGKIVEFVDRQGDLEPSVQSQELKEKTGKLLFYVINLFLRRQTSIPIELRHFASVIRAMSASKFNDKYAAFNAMSALFYLRFLAPIFQDLQGVFPRIRFSRRPEETLQPFFLLLQVPFNGIVFKRRYERYASWNPALVEIFPKIHDFILGIGDLNDEDPYYPSPGHDVMVDSLELVMKTVAEVHQKFHARYEALTADEGVTPAGWALSCFLIGFFKNTVHDQ